MAKTKALGVEADTPSVLTYEILRWKNETRVGVPSLDPRLIIAEFSTLSKANEIIGLLVVPDTPEGDAPEYLFAVREVHRMAGMKMDQDAWIKHAHILETADRK